MKQINLNSGNEETVIPDKTLLRATAFFVLDKNILLAKENLTVQFGHFNGYEKPLKPLIVFEMN